MQFLIFLSCALAFASAGVPVYYGSLYAQHVPLIDHNGVPVDTPEVQEARAHHFAAHAAAKQGGYLAVGQQAGHYGTPAIAADGTPLDTPEVQLAKAAHFIAYNQAALQNSGHGVVAAGPVETPEVQIAKAAHFAAHAEAKARAGHHYRRRRQIVPQIGPNGVPLDLPEVEAAKAAHYALLNKNQPYNQGPYNQGPHQAPYQGPYSNNNYHGPYNNNLPGQSYEYHGQYGYHIPVIGKNGVPVDTPANQAATAAHLAAYGQSRAQGYNPGYQGNYAPPPQHYGK